MIKPCSGMHVLLWRQQFLNVAVSNALKYSVNRERPFITYPDIIKKTDPHSPSFPSGIQQMLLLQPPH